GLRPAGDDANGASGAGRQHHQAHDRGAADLDAILFHVDRRLVAARHLDELGRGTRVQAALVDDLEITDNLIRLRPGAHLPASNWLATLIYLRPAACASSSEACMSSPLRMLVSLISIGRFMPAMISVRPDCITEMARFDGVPP